MCLYMCRWLSALYAIRFKHKGQQINKLSHIKRLFIIRNNNKKWQIFLTNSQICKVSLDTIVSFEVEQLSRNVFWGTWNLSWKSCHRQVFFVGFSQADSIPNTANIQIWSKLQINCAICVAATKYTQTSIHFYKMMHVRSWSARYYSGHIVYRQNCDFICIQNTWELALNFRLNAWHLNEFKK